MKRRLVLYLLLVAFTGTLFGEPLRAKLEGVLMQRLAPETVHQFGSHQVAVRGYPVNEQLALLEFAFRPLPPEMVEDIDAIILQPPQHFPEWIHAHAEALRGVICIRINKISQPPTIWHEAAHIRTYALPRNFADRWREVAGPVYGNYSRLVRLEGGGYATQWLESRRSGPRYGCLSPYGATEYMEDIAVFVQEVYSLLSYHYSDLLLVAFSDDPRYRQKVDLLFAGGFITSEQHSQVKTILGW